MSSDVGTADPEAPVGTGAADAPPGEGPGERRGGFTLPSAYTILFGLIVLTALATWIIPAGRYALHADGDLERAIKAHKKAASFESFRGIGLYNLGCAYALTGQTDKAFEALRASGEAGFTLPGRIEGDPDLDSLRDDPRLAGADEGPDIDFVRQRDVLADGLVVFAEDGRGKREAVAGPLHAIA